MPAYIPPFRARFFDSNGDPLVGGQLFTYQAGTTSPLATYTDAGALTPNSNPVVLDANGECDVFISSGFYKFVLEDVDGVVQWTEDNISIPGGVATSLPAGGSANQVLSKINGTDFNTQWADEVKSTGTSSSPSSITASGGVAFTGNAFKSTWYVKSNSGAVTITANPQIAAGTFEGQELKLIQMSATDTLQFANGNGLALSGASTLILDQVYKMAVFHWDATGTVWVEQSRS